MNLRRPWAALRNRRDDCLRRIANHRDASYINTSGVPFDFKRNVWYYVAAVVTRRGATYYVDGSAIGSVTYRGIPLLFDATHKVEIGTNTRYDTEWFDGAIDEVAVYGYALTTDQIAAHYATGIGN